MRFDFFILPVLTITGCMDLLFYIAIERLHLVISIKYYTSHAMQSRGSKVLQLFVSATLVLFWLSVARAFVACFTLPISVFILSARGL